MLVAGCEDGTTELVFGRGQRALRDGDCSHGYPPPAPLHFDALPAHWLGARPAQP